MNKLLLALLLYLPAVHAQTSAGRIAGVVLDASGAIIPNAKIGAHNADTGLDYRASSNAEGAYVLYPLPPGVYAITAEAPGFRNHQISNVEVDVASVLSFDLRLEVAATKQEAVVVSASATPIVTESPAVESTIVRRQIEALPLNGRDFNQLVLLAPGAVESAYSGADFGGVALNGNRNYGNDYMLDGSPNNNTFQNTASAPVSVDVIREFKVTSGVAAAEYGQAGSQITIVTRSGGNAFHGSAFEYHRDTTWQATNPFNPGTEQPFGRNQFGGSLGGPVVHNRTFFFVNYEGNRQNQTRPVVASMPLDPYWQGDFSSLLARNIQLRDPLAARAPVPQNRIPSSRMDATALKLHPYWNSPIQPGTSNNFVRNSDLDNHGDQFTIRLDQSLRRNNNLSFRFTQANSSAFTPSITANVTGYRNVNYTDNASLGWTAPLTATTIHEMHLGFSEYHNQTIYLPGGLPTASDLGILGFTSSDPGVQPMPQIIFGGTDAFTRLNYGPAGASSTVNQGSKTLSLSEAVTLVRGSHTIKAGVEIRSETLPSILQPNSGGSITFTGNNAVTSTGYSFADFILGIPVNAVQAPPAESVKLKRHEIASYIQDDWRILRRLTLSIGLRHEISSNPYDTRNRLALFDPATGAMVVASDNGKLPMDQFSPVIVSRLTDKNGNWIFPLLSDKQAGFTPRSLLDPHYRNFGPRFGFAYDLGGRRRGILRGGYGLFYNRYPIQNLEQITGINPPFAGNFTYTQSIANGAPAITLHNPYAGSSSASISPGGLVRNWQLPSNQQWNLAIEREIAWGTTLTVSYIGNKGTHLFRAYDANEPRIDKVTAQAIRPYQNTYGTVAISERTSDGTSIYHSMQTVIRRRLSKGLLFEFNWTWAKGLDTVSNALNVSALDVENLGRDRADSDYVRRHTFHANATWELPFGRGRSLMTAAPRWLDSLAGGWRLSGIWTDYTGKRFTPVINNTGLTNNRPSVVYGVAANLPADRRTVQHWFNPAAFTAPLSNCGPFGTALCFGNAGRNILVGPGINVVDASLSKSFPIFGEKRLLTFRLEMFNAFNHPNYGLPDANISNVNTAGSITSLIKDMREAQFAFRFDF